MTQASEHRIVIDAAPAEVWAALTEPGLMKQWMADGETPLEIETDWSVGSPITIRGFHRVAFENKGTILQFQPTELLRYSHLSSISRLPERPENYSIFEFRLAPGEGRTTLTVKLSVFPTEAIFKHLDFYWRVTLHVLKQFVEKR